MCCVLRDVRYFLGVMCVLCGLVSGVCSLLAIVNWLVFVGRRVICVLSFASCCLVFAGV